MTEVPIWFLYDRDLLHERVKLVKCRKNELRPEVGVLRQVSSGNLDCRIFSKGGISEITEMRIPVSTIRSTFRELSKIYDATFLQKKLTNFGRQLLPQKSSIIDVWLGPKYITYHDIMQLLSSHETCVYFVLMNCDF